MWEAPSIEQLVHNSQTVVQQLKAKTLILTRDWKGRHIPDITVDTPIYSGGLKI